MCTHANSEHSRAVPHREKIERRGREREAKERERGHGERKEGRKEEGAGCIAWRGAWCVLLGKAPRH